MGNPGLLLRCRTVFYYPHLLDSFPFSPQILTLATDDVQNILPRGCIIPQQTRQPLYCGRRRCVRLDQIPRRTSRRQEDPSTSCGQGCFKAVLEIPKREQITGRIVRYQENGRTAHSSGYTSAPGEEGEGRTAGRIWDRCSRPRSWCARGG